MKSKIMQIMAGLTISVFILVISIGGGLYLSGIISVPDLTSDDSENISEVKLVNSTLDSSTLSEESLLSVVSIYTEENGELNSQGSGFLYDDNYIMTNEHVIESGDTYYVQYNEGEWSEADLTGADSHTDIAILNPHDIPDYAEPLTLREELPERGNPVIALGSPSDLSGSVTTGIISGTNRNMHTASEFTIPDSIQTDAALNEGNSGGPLMSVDNEDVVGVNTATEGENLGFAVSSRLSHIIGQSLIENGEHEHSYVGIRTIELSPVVDIDDDIDKESGLLVEDIAEDSRNLDKLYTREDADVPDIIVGIEDKEITTNEQLTSYIIRNTTPGDTIDLEVYRNGSVQTVTIELGSRD